jgi:hypothetical protein
MVEMQNQNGDPEMRPQLGENPEHRHRIRSSRNANAQAAARPNHAVPADHVENAFVEIFVHPKKLSWRIPSPRAGCRCGDEPACNNDVNNESRNLTIGRAFISAIGIETGGVGLD